MRKWNTVAIIGAGLLGGSIGMALRSRGLAQHVIGIGRNAGRLRKAKRLGAVTATTTNLAHGVARAELAIVCTPVASVVDFARQVAAACPPGTLITDVGSTKEQIVANLGAHPSPNATFVGSHPMAGSDRSGCEFAQHDLLDDRLVIVTPAAGTAKKDREAIEQFWTSLGANVTSMTPSAHDRLVAATSHLPHLLASVLAAGTAEKELPMVGSGWLDTTRVAAGDAELWKQILMSNRGYVLKSLDKFEKVLATARTALESDNSAKITKILEAGKQNRDSMGS